MSGESILYIIGAYFILLIIISRLTGRKGDNADFFRGSRSSNWLLVSFGMIGASLSGVTFVSATGQVHGSGMGYFQMVLGYVIGYVLIAFVLLPIYYRLNLTSIYEYLGKRFGFYSYKTGAFYFLISRLAGSSIRLLMVAEILQTFVFDAMNVPFWVTVSISVGLIWLYTQRGGIRTIVFTDTLQTAFMLLAAFITFFMIADGLALSPGGLISRVFEQDYSQIWFTDVNAPNHWLKQLLAGAVIAFCMTGLDQDMMQKNLSCKNIRDAKKNVLSLSVVLVFVNLFFLILGGALAYYAETFSMEITMVKGHFKADEIFPAIALDSSSGSLVAVFFILGLIAAAYSSADSALTSLTTSFSIDFLNINQMSEERSKQVRRMVHVGMSILIILTSLLLHMLLDQSALYKVFFLASLTYGPLLGLFVFGITTKRSLIYEWAVIPIAIIVPVGCYFLSQYIPIWTDGFTLGSELLLVNGLLVYLALLVNSSGQKQTVPDQKTTSSDSETID